MLPRQRARTFSKKLDRTIDWLVKQGYMERCMVDGEEGVRITQAGLAYLELHDVKIGETKGEA
jgi:hypothetical protein